jgi:hypothetical protein
VFDEIDSGMKEMESRAPKDKQKKEGEATKTAGKDGKEAEKPTYAKAAQAWWGNARSLSTAEGAGDADDPIVGCRHEGRTQFMRRTDCLARGGEAK